MPYDDLQKDAGRVLADQHVALYRDSEGELHAITSICPHMRCDVGWNDREKVWDCPCHGSRFRPTGEVIRGPAARPLVTVAVPE
jgi:Rieske Fe-S protein